MTDSIMITMIALIVGVYWVRAAETYTRKLTRAMVVCLIVGVIVASMF